MRWLQSRGFAVGLAPAVLAVPLLVQSPPQQAQSSSPPVLLWRDPGPIAQRDLFWGNSAEGRAPQAPFRFVEETLGGTQPKLVVTDGRGDVWDVKLGRETSAEVAASRIVWALGYGTEELYFVPRGVIDGISVNLDRADAHVSADGAFEGARFRRRNPHAHRTDVAWTFHDNPFTGTPELSGLIILMTMIGNWDIEGGRNNNVLEIAADGVTERWYIVSDLGATFGRMGGVVAGHTKWDLPGFQAEGFIEQVDDGTLHLDYDGLESGIDRVPLEHAQWFLQIVRPLTAAHLRRAFEAAGAPPDEAQGFAAKMAEKIGQLEAVVRTGRTAAR
jgi:hypothetical protein